MLLVDHPYRSSAMEELHLRPMIPAPIPGEIVQLVRLPTMAEWERAIELIEELGQAPVPHGARHVAGLVGTIDWSVERHTEAATLTAVIPADAAAADRDRITAWLEAMPGGVLRATRTRIVATDEAAAQSIAAARFDQRELVAARFGVAEYWSDFRISSDDGLGRAIVNARTMPRADVGRFVRQIHELGNYRNLALMGLPAVRNSSADLVAIEHGLAEASAQLSDRVNDELALDRLLALAAQCAELQARLQFRLGATRAYGQVAIDRLHALNSRKIEGYQSLVEFTERRLLPALRTCEAFAQRLERASQGIERATSMLRTRIEHEVQQQNMALLASVERSAGRQVALQQLVEGLSVVALTYYAIGLAEIAVRGARTERQLGLEPDQLLALLILPVMVVTALVLRARRLSLARRSEPRATERGDRGQRA